MTAADDEASPPEQSMDDILASIRRMMLDEQARLKDAGAPEGAAAAAPAAFVLPSVPVRAVGDSESILVLDDTMVVPSPAASVASAETSVDHALPVAEERSDAAEQTVGGAAASPSVISGLTAQAIEEMLAPAAAAAAAASVDALLRKLAEERQALLQPASSSPTMEEFVRAELRPLLKSWLDENLPAIVERLVRAELARLTLRHGV